MDTGYFSDTKSVSDILSVNIERGDRLDTELFDWFTEDTDEVVNNLTIGVGPDQTEDILDYIIKNAVNSGTKDKTASFEIVNEDMITGEGEDFIGSDVKITSGEDSNVGLETISRAGLARQAGLKRREVSSLIGDHQ